MSDIVIRAEKLGKKFVIGHKVEYSAILGEALVRSARGILRRGVDMVRGRAVVEGDEVEEFWALRDVDFEIRRGEVVSIIGHTTGQARRPCSRSCLESSSRRLAGSN